MIPFPPIDPVALQIGPVAIRWYGLAYLAGIAAGWMLLNRRARLNPAQGWNEEHVGDLVFYAAIGAVLGGRLGYALFYDFKTYVENPADVFAVWRGGMSFHGGVLGMVTALWWFGRRTGRGFFNCSDFVVPVVPIGLGLGRIANFINQELWGAPTTLPWGVVFTAPGSGGLPRHPSQLYEALLEGVLLFMVLALVRQRSERRGVVSATFLIGYAICRMMVELVREPDAHLGYLWGGWLTMGQVLCVPMVLAGVGILFWSRRAVPAVTAKA